MATKHTEKEQSFLQATVILGIATMLVKVLGAIFKIPLQRLIGDDGMGFYSTAYDIYLPIYSLAMAGFPVAVSRMVADQVGKERYRDARRTLRVVAKVFLIAGTIGLLLMYGASFIVTAVTGNVRARPGMFVIAPSIFFCCVMSIYRGYYEGVRNMYPTAVSSVIEAVCKLVLGYSFAFIIVKSASTVTLDTLSYAVAGAMLGITLGTVLGSAYLIWCYTKKGDGITNQMLRESPAPMPQRKIFKMLVAIAVPVALGSLVTQVSGLIDVVMVQGQLKSTVAAHPESFTEMYQAYQASGAAQKSGFEIWVANRLYGCYKGSAYTMFNFVPTITSVLGVSAIPVLTMVWGAKNSAGIRKNIESIIKIISLIAFPMGAGMVALAPQIIQLLFKSSEPVITANLLRILGLAACCAGLSTPLTNMLQAIGRQGVPVRNIGVGAIIKILSNLTLVAIPSIHVMGAAIGTLLCYIYIAGANLFCLIRYSGTRPNMKAAVLRPFIAAALCGVAAFAVAFLGQKLLGSASLLANAAVTCLGILAAVVVYLLAVAAFKCLTEQDIRTLAKGEKVIAVLKRLKIVV